ncbi:colibactin biosynthesis amidase ClbL [Gilliamella sp. App4-10]|uniref:colibactin biosynthesis amidase ClbL n=1 Tax=Gilliamella sp. App4-10 TaxID=3120231 RepID=UPI00080DE623|nr:colibactin biosynthesis amidase ClbL [Gilliamella apicola]OCG21785.1 amidase [Gilliamella apicola]
MSDHSQYRTATELLAQLANGETTSVALVEYYFDRIAKFNESLNAVVQLNKASALKDAEQADKDRQAGKAVGILHGLPCTIKDSFDVRGWLTTSGANHLKNNRAVQDAPSIARLRAAGAIFIGKTNVPTMTADWQTYNDLYGTTNSPWDLQRSPGGSSGGAAVALAADFTPVEFGSDLFGSMRVPAHYTGVYAHRCSLGLMSVRGHMPGGGPHDTTEPDLSTSGPMARCAADLRLMMQALNSFWVKPPRIPDFSRYHAHKKYRICTWFNAVNHPLDDQVAERFRNFIEILKAQFGIEIDEAMPAGIDPEQLFDVSVKLSGRLVGTALNARQRLTAGLASLGYRLLSHVQDVPEGMASYYKGMTNDINEQDTTDRLREQYSNLLKELFSHYDILLMPVSPVVAFHHMQQPVNKRKLKINGVAYGYNEHLFWNMLPTVFGLPATIYPLAKQDGELPCAIQIVSGHFNDDITIDFAEFCEGITGGFAKPNGY